MPIITQLDKTIKEINNQHDLRAIILQSSEEGYFCSGADLK
jgi:enoyl-CoA hydratase/carnithine racemase